jgi:hypothetical protein
MLYINITNNTNLPTKFIKLYEKNRNLVICKNPKIENFLSIFYNNITIYDIDIEFRKNYDIIENIIFFERLLNNSKFEINNDDIYFNISEKQLNKIKENYDLYKNIYDDNTNFNYSLQIFNDTNTIVFHINDCETMFM